MRWDHIISVDVESLSEHRKTTKHTLDVNHATPRLRNIGMCGSFGSEKERLDGNHNRGKTNDEIIMMAMPVVARTTMKSNTPRLN